MSKLVIREDRCKSCEICVEYCPNDCLVITEKLNSQGYRVVGIKDEECCISCAICARMCPDLVFEVYKSEGK